MDGLKGRLIKEIRIDEYKVLISFSTDKGNYTYFIKGLCCCYESYIQHFEGLDALIGHVVIDVENHEGDRTFDSDKEAFIQIYFTKFTTEAGRATLEYRNASRGHHGVYIEFIGITESKAYAKCITKDF